MSERSYDDMADEDADRKARNAGNCKCFGEMPGSCPGPHNCPMCEVDQDDDDEAEHIAADLAYNAEKPLCFERDIETAMRNEIQMRMLTREIL